MPFNPPCPQVLNFEGTQKLRNVSFLTALGEHQGKQPQIGTRQLPTTCNPRNSCGNWARGAGEPPQWILQEWGCKLPALWGVQEGGDPHVSLPTPLAGSFPHTPFTCISMPSFSPHSSILETVSFRCQGDLAWKDFCSFI